MKGWQQTAMRWIPALLPPAALILLTCWIGLPLLKDWRGPAFTLTNELYIPSAMFAVGQGFIRPPVDEIPGMREFMYPTVGDAAWNPGTLPDSYSRTNWDTYERYHRYLIYAMGIVWSIFGVSWTSAKILAIGLYAVATLLVYALFRLGTNRLFAFAGAALFAAAPAVAENVFNIRDFSKAPFLIALFGLFCYLFFERRPVRQYLLAALLAGVVIGIGLGFRRDLLIAIPPALMATLLARLEAPGFAWRLRLAGVAVLFVSMLITSLPIVSTFRDRGSLAAHDIVMGFSTICDDQMGLSRTSYERVPMKHDLFASGIAGDFARRKLVGNNPAYADSYVYPSESFKAMYIRENIRVFPADMLLRGWGATMQILHGAKNKPVGWLPGEITARGSLYAALALGLIAFRSLPLALMLFLLGSYFCAVTSLQFEVRHSFHMAFLPAAACVIPAHALWTLARGLWKRRLADGEAGEGRRDFAAWAAAGKRVLLFYGAAAGIIMLPWGLALLAQRGNVASVEEALRSATLEPLEVTHHAFGEWTYFRPQRPLPKALPDPTIEQPYFRGHYLAIDFESYEGESPLQWLVSSADSRQDYSLLVHASPSMGESQRVRCFIHIPEHVGEVFASWFDAVGLPSKHAEAFRGLYLVTTAGPIGTHCAFALAENSALQRRVQTLRWPGTLAPHQTAPVPPANINARAKELHALAAADPAAAIPRLRESLAWGLLRPELRLALSNCLAATGAHNEAAATLLEGLREMPDDWTLAYAYARAIAAGTPEASYTLAAWESAAEVAPDNVIVKKRLQFAREQAKVMNP